jgi:hypothetical protein
MNVGILSIRTNFRFSIFAERAQLDDTKLVSTGKEVAVFEIRRSCFSCFSESPGISCTWIISSVFRSIAMTHHVYIKCNSFSIVPISLEDGFISYAFHSFSYCVATYIFTALRRETLSASTGTATYRARVVISFSPENQNQYT